MTITQDGRTWTQRRDGTWDPARPPAGQSSRRAVADDELLVLDEGDPVPPGTKVGTVILTRGLGASGAPVLVLDLGDPVPPATTVGTVILRRP